MNDRIRALYKGSILKILHEYGPVMNLIVLQTYLESRDLLLNSAQLWLILDELKAKGYIMHKASKPDKLDVKETHSFTLTRTGQQVVTGDIEDTSVKVVE